VPVYMDIPFTGYSVDLTALWDWMRRVEVVQVPEITRERYGSFIKSEMPAPYIPSMTFVEQAVLFPEQVKVDPPKKEPTKSVSPVDRVKKVFSQRNKLEDSLPAFKLRMGTRGETELEAKLYILSHSRCVTCGKTAEKDKHILTCKPCGTAQFIVVDQHNTRVEIVDLDDTNETLRQIEVRQFKSNVCGNCGRQQLRVQSIGEGTRKRCEHCRFEARLKKDKSGERSVVVLNKGRKSSRDVSLNRMLLEQEDLAAKERSRKEEREKEQLRECQRENLVYSTIYDDFDVDYSSSGYDGFWDDTFA